MEQAEASMGGVEIKRKEVDSPAPPKAKAPVEREEMKRREHEGVGPARKPTPPPKKGVTWNRAKRDVDPAKKEGA